MNHLAVCLITVLLAAISPSACKTYLERGKNRTSKNLFIVLFNNSLLSSDGSHYPTMICMNKTYEDQFLELERIGTR